MEMSPDTIKDMAVRAVQGYVHEGKPLSHGVAEIAKEHDLNKDQIERVIEATNSIAYLKLLDGAKDRTFEFPVANYKDVIGHVALPSDGPELDMTPDIEESDDLYKDAGVNILDSMTTHEKQAALMSEFMINKSALEKIAFDIQEVALQIEASLNKLAKDEFVLEKLAAVLEEDKYNSVVNTMYGHVKQASEGFVYRERELSEARNLSDLLKQAELLFIQRQTRTELHEKMAGILSNTIGSVVGNALKIPGQIVGRTAGGIVGGAVGATGSLLATKPVKTVAKISALPLLGGLGIKAKSGPDVWDALHS